MKKVIIIAAAIILTASLWCSAFFIHKAKHLDSQLQHCYEILHARSYEVFVQENLLHRIYQDNPTAWNEYIVTTNEYAVLDDIREGNWEDFYYIW